MARGQRAGSVSDDKATVAYASGSLFVFYNDGMFIAAWIAFFLVMLFLLGCTVGSFLNVCIVRLPQGRSLIRPPSSCAQCGKPIHWQDNIPLLSYWLLRGRCRACGASFTMRYFWIELLTGLLFVLIYHLEVARNIHHFEVWQWYIDDYSYALMQIADPQQWLIFSIHAVMGCLLIVAAMCLWEHGQVPRRVTAAGLFLGLLTATFFPWPWPEPLTHVVLLPSQYELVWERNVPVSSLGRRVGAMPGDQPWWRGDVTPRQGLYPWPVWGPLPEWLPVGSWRLGLATGLAGILASAALMGLVRLLFNIGVGSEALGEGEMSILMIAGGFLGWQLALSAGLIALIPGLAAATRQWTVKKKSRVTYGLWLVPPLVTVWLGWYWIGPLVQNLFFDAARTLWLVTGCISCLVAFAACLRLMGVARPGMSA